MLATFSPAVLGLAFSFMLTGHQFCGFRGIKDGDQNDKGPQIQTQDDGHSHRRQNMDLGRQPIRGDEYKLTRFDVEEEVQFGGIPLHTQTSGCKRDSDKFPMIRRQSCRYVDESAC